jgi:CubicO group peptidase (beta-lactamase class C family)
VKIFRMFLPFILFVSALATHAQNSTTTAIDSFVQSELQRQRIPGVALAIVKDGKVVLAKGYGIANVEHQVPVKVETIFQSGSVGKQFTATAVMMLVEDGKISLDEKISKYLGEVPESWRNINVRHLLTHTSGMTDYPPDFDFRRDYTEDELLKRAQQVPTAFQPGEKWQYSNLAYVTLGILIHKVSGKFYGDFLQERVFKPLGMTTTRIINEADIVPNRAAGYRLARNELKNQGWVSPTLNTTADGALYLTVLDLAKWDAALYGETLVKKATLDQMWTKVKLNDGSFSDYGFGWALNQWKERRLIEHGGAWQGFTSHIARFVDNKLTVIVLDNLAGGNAGKIAHRVAAIYEPALARTAIEDKDPQVTLIARNLLVKLTQNSTSAADFTPAGLASVGPRAERISRNLQAQGPLTTFDLIARAETKEGRLFVYQLMFEKGSLLFRLTVSQNNKVVDLYFRDDY